jgi:cell division protein FtsN
MPEVETVEVPERVIVLADDLDIPDFAFEDKAGEAPVFDDIDADFAGLLNEMNDAEPTAVTSRAVSYDDDAYEAGFKHDHVEAPAYGEQRPSVLPDGAMAAATAAYGASAAAGFAASRSTDEPSFSSGAAGMDNLDYDPSFDEEMSVPDAATADAARQPSNRGLMLAAVVGAVAVIGGVGAFALSFGGSDGSGAPVLIKADNQPIKVKPENPGGTVIPNQDNKVYDVVANGAKPAAPEQKKLVADAQEPVDVNARPPLADSEQPAAEDVGSGQKSEARLLPSEPVADETESKAVAAVAPRKVKTLIVKPDGTLVPREEAEPAVSVAAGEPADPAPQHVVNTSSEDQTGTVPQTASADAQRSQMPETAPVAPQRPADQPVDIVGEVKPETVASIAPENAASGGWAMQIASQPSVESAQKTYQNLSRRYESILGGHDAKIVKAEIAGKGTFYRVRIAANSRDDAINLCTSYKAAGGNCFVSK